MTKSSLGVGWGSPADDGGRGDVYYTVKYKAQEDTGFTEVNMAITQTSRLLSSLKPYTRYEIIIAAGNGVTDETPSGEETEADPVFCRTSEDGKKIKHP